MQNTKTFALLQTLSKKDIESLKSQIKANKRKSLFELFNLCLRMLNSKKNIDLKAFFELFYKKKYNTKDDNAFRNELRLLNGLIENYIVKLQFEKQLKNDFYLKKKFLLDYLLAEESYDLLEKELAKVFKQIETNEDFNFSYDFILLWTKLQSKNFKMESKFFLETRDSFYKLFSNWTEEVAIKTKKLEIFNAFIARVSFMVSRELKFDENISQLNFELADNSNYYNFLKNKALSFKSAGDEKFKILLNMLDQLEKIITNDININQEKFTTLQYLGVEKMLKVEYEEAAIFFKQSLELENFIDEKTIAKGLYNYVSTLVKLKKYDEAIALYNNSFEKIKNSNILDIFNSIIAMSYIFLNETEKAESVNEVIDSNKSVGNFLYSRCNLAIIHFENDQKELALNELTNISQSVNYHKNQDKAYQEFTSKFKIFIQISYSKSLLSQNQSKLIKMQTELKENIGKSNLTYGGDSLHILWLLDKISLSISS